MNNEDLQNEEIDEVNTPSEENEEARTDKEYSDDYLTSAIEAILFSVGESVSIDRLASALEMDKRKLPLIFHLVRPSIISMQILPMRFGCM